MLKVDRERSIDLYLVNPTKVQQLECKALAGEVRYDEKGLAFRYALDSRRSVAASSPFTLEWGFIKNLSIPKVEKKSFKISGMVIGASIQSEDISENIEGGAFSFEYNSYDLKSKACLTKVPVTIPFPIRAPFLSRPTNIYNFWTY